MTNLVSQQILITAGSPLLKQQCPVTREDFQIGEYAVICPNCNTAYKAASWKFIGGRCVVCAGPQSAHVPPPPVEQRPAPQPLEAAPPPTVAAAKPGAKPSAAGLAWLVGPNGYLHSIALGDNNIGRAADNDLVIENASVSAHHARIRYGGGRSFYLYDLASTNGTTVNGHPVNMILLYDNDQIAFGEAHFQYRQVDYQNS